MSPSIICPNLIYEVVMSDDSALDSAIFTFDATAGTLTTQSSNASSAKSYSMKLTASYGATYHLKGSQSFTFKIIDCEKLKVKAPSVPSILAYTVGDPSVEASWSDFIVTPVECTGFYTF